MYLKKIHFDMVDLISLCNKKQLPIMTYEEEKHYQKWVLKIIYQYARYNMCIFSRKYVLDLLFCFVGISFGFVNSMF